MIGEITGRLRGRLRGLAPKLNYRPRRRARRSGDSGFREWFRFFGLVTYAIQDGQWRIFRESRILKRELAHKKDRSTIGLHAARMLAGLAQARNCDGLVRRNATWVSPSGLESVRGVKEVGDEDHAKGGGDRSDDGDNAAGGLEMAFVQVAASAVVAHE